MIFDFDEQLYKGRQYEAFLDKLFAAEYDIIPATDAEQRKGIDRHYIHKVTRNWTTVEYKADLRASETHNAFIETVSVDTTNAPGWVYKSKAKYLLYLTPGNDLLYIIQFSQLRTHLAGWLREFPVRSVPNKGYHTIGILVPLEEIEHISQQVVNL